MSMSSPTLGGFICGLVSGVVASALSALPTGTVASLAVASCTAGMLVATPFAGYLATAMGTKRAVKVALSLLAASGPLFFIASPEGITLLSARFMQGASLGFLYVLFPLQLSETLPPERRGRGMGLFQFFLLGGQVTGAVYGMLLTNLIGVSPSLWRIAFATPTLPALMLTLPLVNRNSSTAADEVARENPKCHPASVPPTTGELRKLCLAVTMLAFCSAIGIGPVTNFTVRIMHGAGVTGISANSIDIAMQTLAMAATFLGAHASDAIGRRRTLISGIAGCLVALLLLTMATHSHVSTMLAATSLMLFSASYAFGPGVCCWLMLCEIMPSRIRASGMSLALLANHAVSVFIAASFAPAAETFGLSTVFATLFSASLVFLVLVILFLPETNGAEIRASTHRTSS